MITPVALQCERIGMIRPKSSVIPGFRPTTLWKRSDRLEEFQSYFRLKKQSDGNKQIA